MLLSPEWLGKMQFRWLKRSMHDGSIEGMMSVVGQRAHRTGTPALLGDTK